MSASEIIELVLTELDLKAPTFAKNIGVGQQRIHDIQSGKTKSISGNLASKIVNTYPQFNINWLITGEGEMLISDKKTNSLQSNTNTSTPYNYSYTVKNFLIDYYSYLNYKEIQPMLLEKQLSELTEDEITEISHKMGLNHNDLVTGIEIINTSPRTGKLVPIYNAFAGAGNGVANHHGTREGWTNVGDLLKDSEGSLYVYGNSMIPGYPPGSLVGIRPLNETFIEPGSVYVIETESNRYIKRLYYNEDKTGFVCMSDNHIKHTDGPMEGSYFYLPFEIPLPAVRRIYKVVGVIKRNSIAFT